MPSQHPRHSPPWTQAIHGPRAIRIGRRLAISEKVHHHPTWAVVQQKNGPNLLASTLRWHSPLRRRPQSPPYSKMRKRLAASGPALKWKQLPNPQLRHGLQTSQPTPLPQRQTLQRPLQLCLHHGPQISRRLHQRRVFQQSNLPQHQDHGLQAAWPQPLHKQLPQHPQQLQQRGQQPQRPCQRLVHLCPQQRQHRGQQISARRRRQPKQLSQYLPVRLRQVQYSH